VNAPYIVAIAGSSGAIQAVRDLIACLPRSLPAACCAVLHQQRTFKSQLAQLLERDGGLRVRLAEDGEPLQAGVLLLARPDRHLVIGAEQVQLTYGPRENFWRPSIDVLFRTAAVSHRTRAIGVLLSGTLDDGIAGLAAIRACGGRTLVQSPGEAAFGELPATALREVEGTVELTVAEICADILHHTSQPPAPAPPIPAELELEARIATDTAALVADMGMPQEDITLYNCPECGGPLAPHRGFPLHYRCMVGHSFTAWALEHGMQRKLEASLWVAVRLLQQRSNLSRSHAGKEQQHGRERAAHSYTSRADEDWSHAEVLRRLLVQLSAARPSGSE
jgi:two-component system, chemotaxis family, protein-glutamate methylesterase/glutaminase